MQNIFMLWKYLILSTKRALVKLKLHDNFDFRIRYSAVVTDINLWYYTFCMTTQDFRIYIVQFM